MAATYKQDGGRSSTSYHWNTKRTSAAITDRDNQIRGIQHENVGLQDEIRAKDQQIAALQRRYVGYFANEDKNNGITIIAKRNEEVAYPYISTCGQHGHRRHKTRVLLERNEGSIMKGID